ncbi:MAG: shikimate dehydrogenase [Lachnospiraceae bacterium]|nr:shikimate dehydrogenase [Lachnospiraceae bacterium]
MEYGLIGEKLGHSYSKQIHGEFADYHYELLPLTREEFPVFMEKKDFRAINVTIPYKRDVLPYLSFLDPLSRRIGAVNTIVNRDGKLYGYNTDYYGFLYLLDKNGILVTGKKVLVLGNGGVAQPVFLALSERGAADVLIVKHREGTGVLTYAQAAAMHADADIIINTSPVGMFPDVDATPIDLTPYKNLYAAVDLIANPQKTRFLSEAEKMGVKTAGGLAMLVAQAKYAVEFFLDLSIDDAKIAPVEEKIASFMEQKKNNGSP